MTTRKFLVRTMITSLALFRSVSASTKLTFQFPSSPLSRVLFAPSSPFRSSSPTHSTSLQSFYLRKQWHSSDGLNSGTSAAFGRSTFRQIRGDTQSWMTSSSDDSEPEPTSPPASDDFPDLTPYQNPNNLNDQVFAALSSNGGLKVTVTTIRNLLNDMMLQHNMNPLPGDALGRATACALMASNGMQPEQMFQLTLKGDGPLRGCVVIVTGKGEARGFVGNAALGGDFTLREAIGGGTVQVVKNHPEWPRPYNGITAIRHGDIDRDVGEFRFIRLKLK